MGKFLLRRDPVLILSLAMGLLFGLHGINWGRVECWNRDQMAMLDLHGRFPPLPFTYVKPPLHTYLNHMFVLRPIAEAEHLLKKLPASKNINLNEWRLFGSRLLVVAMWLGTIFLAYRISENAFGRFAARIISLLFATSAGFVAHEHFLSCDSPLLFFMVLTAFFSQRIALSGDLRCYIIAGLCAGLSAAMKYNGVVVAVAIVAAHIMANYRNGLRTMLLDRRLFIGCFSVAVGFVGGNPGAIFDHRKFLDDFIYNFKITPHYGGRMSGHGYVQFLERLPEVLGWPGAVLVVAAAIVSLGIVVRRRDFRNPGTLGFALAAIIFFLYFKLIGAFPRMETRYVLAAVPFLILMTGPLLQKIANKRRLIYAMLIPLLLYNAICCFFVGQRFGDDPRMQAQVWMQKHIQPAMIIESSPESPSWTKLPGIHGFEVRAANPDFSRKKPDDAVDWRMPFAYGRLPLFLKMFRDDPWIQAHVSNYEIEADERLYTRDELLKRNPEVISVYSPDYSGPSTAVRNYYSDLLAGKFPYVIVFDGQTVSPPRWIYPREIDFLSGRIVILQRVRG